MIKTKKALASLAITGMALTMVPFNAFATGTVPTHLAGTTAAQTAVAIADQTGWTGTAILASSASYGMVDALTAGPLAFSLKAPILLTGAGSTLDADTKAELTKLAVKKVYVTSGTAVISQAVLDQISAMGITVVPLGGADRAATSVNIAKNMVGVTRVAVANGLQDALSIAAIASAANEPILLTDQGAIPASVADYLRTNTAITASDVIGGTGIISDAVKAALPGATRHAGTSAYDTNNQVIQDFSSALTYGNVYVANGVTGIDALAGAPLAAMTKSAIVLTDGTVPAAATFVSGKLVTGSVVTALGGAAVVSDAVRTAIVTGVPTPAQGALSVTSVKAVSINGIKVIFNHAPADTSKVVFAVTRTASPAVVTPSWNDAKTEATLTSSGNFAEGDYIVDVKDGATPLGTSTVSFTSQRVGKISVDSNVLAVTSSGAIGFTGYHVYDQYGTDITTSYLAGDSYIQWNCGVGTVVSNGKGLLTVTPFSGSQAILTQYQTAVVTAVTKNQSIPASVNATLNISTTQGTISDITLNKLTSADNAIPTVGDTAKYYIDYSAKDMAGNATNTLTLVQRGLITNHVNASDDYPLISSNSTLVTAKIVESPGDDQKAAIEVTIKDPSDYNLQQDQPITITASTYTGKTSSMTFTLRRKQALDSFTLMAPAINIASGETGTVMPFTATDQAGKPLTKYSDLKDRITLSPDKGTGTVGLYLEENADGTGSLKYDAPVLDSAITSGQQQNLSASVKNTGKFSSITINVDLAKKVDSLKLIDALMVPRLEVGAYEPWDFGFNEGGFQVLDQYGRVIDMTSKFEFGGYKYFLQATVATSEQGIVKVVPGRSVAYAGHEIIIKGIAPGTATVKFELMKTEVATNTTTSTSLTKNLSISVLDDKDIVGYVLQPVDKPFYAVAEPTPAHPQGTDQQIDFSYKTSEPYVFGITASKSLVVLDLTKVTRSTSSADFSTIIDKSQTQVVANKLANETKTGASATLIITTINSNDNRPHTATTAISSITDAPVAKSVGFTGQTVDRKDKATETGITSDGNTVTVSLAGHQSFYSAANAGGTNTFANVAAATSLNFTAIGGTDPTSILNAIAGRDLTRFTAADVAASTTSAALTAGSGSNRGYVYLWAKDQYGSKAMNLSNLLIAESSTKELDHANFPGVMTPVATILNNTLQFKYMPTAADYIMISGVSSNGLVQTIKIVFK